MPDYLVRIRTEVVMGPSDLDSLEDVVYDYVVDALGGSAEVDAEGVGFTDVETVYN